MILKRNKQLSPRVFKRLQKAFDRFADATIEYKIDRLENNGMLDMFMHQELRRRNILLLAGPSHLLV